MRRLLYVAMVSQVLCADLNTRNLRPQYWSISGMKGRASRLPRSSRVARISSALRTCTQSPARRSKRSFAHDLALLAFTDSLSKQNCHFIAHLAGAHPRGIAATRPAENQESLLSPGNISTERCNAAGNRRSRGGWSASARTRRYSLVRPPTRHVRPRRKSVFLPPP